jgi:peptidoglycan/xylan/chitin deacetylase (PgdA/CDA1 family)
VPAGVTVIAGAAVGQLAGAVRVCARRLWRCLVSVVKITLKSALKSVLKIVLLKIVSRQIAPPVAVARLWLGLLCGVLAGLPAQAAVILQYHHVSETAPAATRVTPARFKAHMQHLAEQGYQVVPLADLIAARQQGKPLPDKAVAITFDDGYDSIATRALPILKAHGWPFTVFISTQPIDQGLAQFMTWDQVRELAANGGTIANHTVTHTHMIRRLPGETEVQWRARMQGEIEQAQARLEAEVGELQQWLAYPYGEFDRALEALVTELGYVGIAQTSGPLAQHSPLTALPRFPFGGIYGDMNDFATKVATLPLPLAQVQVLDQRGQPVDELPLPRTATRPGLQLQLQDAALAARVQCYSQGKPVSMQRDGATLVARTDADLGPGRGRYNCTAGSTQKGRFYWYSHQFIRTQADGEWYFEL